MVEKRRTLLLSARGKSLPWPFSIWATPQKADVFGGCRSPHPAAADLFHSLLSLMAVVMLSGLAWADEIPQSLPPSLEPWRGWVLHEVADIGCPSPYDNGSERLCLWPSALRLDLGPQGGTWQTNVQAFAETWLPLPGDADTWPEGVLLDDNVVPVVPRDGVPSIQLGPGSHQISGGFSWQQPPERIALPTSIGIVSLWRNGEPVRIPDRDAKGLLWLRRARAAATEQDQISIQVYRVLEDGLPLWLRTELELTVSGKSREVELGGILPVGWQLSSVDGPIPVAIDAAGHLRAQVRPGTWPIRITAFRTEDTSELVSPAAIPPAAAKELVAVRARPEFRTLEMENAMPVDVNLTTFPEAWRDLPVFQWETAKPLRWIVKATGGGLRQPDRFRVSRRLWLDEDGRGITYEDTITGECREISRLDAADGHHLEVVRSGGERQLITRDPATEAEGVELRSPRPDVQAIGRTERTPSLAATGWQIDADSLDITLSLPPGWRMLAVFGADRVQGDWLTAWTLLDLFLLLVFSVGVFRMRGLAAGLLAFLAFGLAYHEADAPRFTWLFLLAPVALLQVTHSPRVAWWLNGWRFLAMGVLLLHLVPFVAREVKATLFPQLEPTGIHYRERDLFDILDIDPFPSPEGYPYSTQSDSSLSSRQGSKKMAGRGAELVVQGNRMQLDNMQFAPGTRTQTGIAKPAWDGNRVVCRWDGPVDSGQTLRTLLLPSWLHRCLAMIRVVLLGLLLRELVRRLPQRSVDGCPPAIPTVTAVAVVALCMTWPAPLAAQSFPDAKLLEDLRGRLLEPSDAFPAAADIPSATLSIASGRLRLEARVDAAADCAVPVPGRLPTWSPMQITLDGQAAITCRRDDGYLWVQLDRGVHTLVAEGLLPDTSEWVWNCHLMPRKLEIDAADWLVKGLGDDGRPEGPLFFTRREEAQAGDAAYDQKNFRSVIQVDRVLEMGLAWKVHTTVRRLSESGPAITLEVPLLAGERVISGSGNGPQGGIEVTLPAAGMEFHWESELPITKSITLESKAGPQWVERWSLVPSAVWNVRFKGLNAVYEEASETLVPVWYPWPGESVVLTIERPQAIDGQTLTVQSVSRKLDLGRRRRNTRLELQIESSLGGEFPVHLPAEATVRSVQRDGRMLPIRREEGRVMVGLAPGSQEVAVEWATDMPLTLRAAFEPIGLPVDAANVTSEMEVPSSRWILWAAGPLRGPAVLFWVMLCLAVILGMALGRIAGSPLATHEWVLLLVGLTQVSLFAAATVVAWLFLLARRGRRDPQTGSWLAFDLMQLVLVGLSVASLLILVVAVSRGLLGQPEMFITGNGSSGDRLRWLAPDSAASLDCPRVISVSIWFYRALMLLWGLWLANALTRWLVVGWRQFTAGGGWRRRQKRLA